MVDFQEQGSIHEQVAMAAKASPSREICGLIVDKGTDTTFISLTNISEDNNSFIIDPIEYAKYTSKYRVIAVVHSHIDCSSEPSLADIVVCNKGSSPWMIYSTVTDTFNIIYPKKETINIIGRPYIFGIYDCWSIVTDTYYADLGISISRPLTATTDWYKDGFNLFETNANSFGFYKLEDTSSLKKYDVILFKAGKTKVPNHCGLLIKEDMFMHHLSGRLSNKEVYGGYWHRYTHAIYRYKGLNK